MSLHSIMGILYRNSTKDFGFIIWILSFTELLRCDSISVAINTATVYMVLAACVCLCVCVCVCVCV